jgi:hypothetical protein
MLLLITPDLKTRCRFSARRSLRILFPEVVIYGNVIEGFRMAQ